MPLIDLAPLDSEGLRLNSPAHANKWAKLTNVSFRDGSLVPRPGFKEAYGYTHQVVSSAGVEPSPAKGLVQIRNAGSSAAGRGGAPWIGEMLRPNGSSSVVAGWTASATTLHGDTDEAVPDGAYAKTTTLGSRFGLTFSDTTAAYTDILGVMVHVRARVEYSGVNDARAILTLYQYDGSSLYSSDVFEIWAFDVDETSFWYDYSFLLEKNLIDSETWDDADLDAFRIVLEYTAGTTGAEYYMSPTSLPSNTGWLDAVDGGAAAVGDIKLTRESTPDALPNLAFPPEIFNSVTTGNGLTADNASDVLEVNFANVPGGVTFTLIDKVDLTFRVKTEKITALGYQLIYNNATVDTVVLSGVTIASCRDYSQPLFVSMTTNPAAGGAWTVTQVNAATFKLKILEDKQLTIEWAQLTVTGTISGGEVRVDTVSAEVLAPGVNTDTDKLVLSNKSFLLLQPGDLTIDNVTNSVPSTTTPPIAPFDHATIYGQTYVVNGTDPTKRYPTSGSVFESLTTNNADGITPITGRTICSFANRILYGWVKDNSTFTPERIAYSQFQNGGIHDHISAGDFDIIDSPGGIVALRPLNESLCFAGKEEGIYSLRRTGNSAAPIIVDPIDYETGCVAQFSSLRALLKNIPVIMFFGQNSTSGLNVYAFDGTSVTPIGDAINPLLEDLANPKMNSLAIGAVDPRTNSYVLFLAPGREIDRTIAFSMNLNSLSWTKWDLPYSIYSSDLWSFQSETALVNSLTGTNLAGESFSGLPTLVLGGRNNLPLRAHNLPYDSLTAPQGPGVLDANDIPGFSPPDDQRPTQKSVFTSTLETGDLQILDPGVGEIQLLSFRLHLDTVNYGPVRIAVSTSIDGGANFNTETISYIGDMTKDGSAQHSFLDMDTPVNDRKIRFRIRVLPRDSTWELPFFWQIDRIFIEYQRGGINGP